MKRRAVGSVLFAAFCWGIIGLFIRPLSALGYTTMEICLIRAFVTAVFAFIWLACQDPRKVKINPRDWWRFFGAGIVSFVFFSWCYFNCLLSTSLSIAAVLLYTAPIFVMGFSVWLFQEHFTPRKGLALVLAFGGCVLVTGLLGGGRAQLSGTGILFGLGAGFGYALYSIFGRYGLMKYASLTVTAWSFAFATAGCLPFVNWGHLLGLMAAQPQSVWGLLACGVITSAVPYVCYTAGLAHMEASRASIIACFEPVVATVMGIVVYQEPVTVTGICGMVCVLGAVFLLNSRTQKNPCRE